MTESRAKFDPAKGEQVFSTGFVGGLYMLAMVGVYLYYRLHDPLQGGPGLENTFRWLPGTLVQYDLINRDYYNLAFIVVLGFVLMVCWDKCTATVSRLLLGCWCFTGGLLALRVAHGQPFIIAAETRILPGWSLTPMEAVYAVQAGGLLCILLFLGPSLPRPPRALSIDAWAVSKSAFLRWGASLLLFSLVLLITYRHPFYLNGYYENWRISCAYLYSAFLFLGYPYVWLTIFFKGRYSGNRSDPGFVLLLLFRSLLKSLRTLDPGPFRVTIHHRMVLVTLRDLLVKMFFVPLMITFFFNECGNLTNHLPVLLDNIKNSVAFITGFPAFYGVVFASIFIMDVGLSTIGYCSSSRWLGNKSRSVDPTLSGWVFALACYPPFNQVTSKYLPYDQYGREQVFALFSGETTQIILKCLTLVFYGVFVWATMAFGLRFSNLTNRGIITRGPYAFVRHPAYMAKNLAWWTSSLVFFSNPWQFVFLFLWNVVYIYRALTEERHLLHDPFYVQYCEKVRWRFIPGLI